MVLLPPPSGRAPGELPEHLLHQVIMPRLPFKCLSRWKCLSKEIHSLITTNAQFSDDQARNSAATCTSSFVFISPGGLSFFPDQASTGVPDPLLQFVNPSSTFNIVSSTNGLLLLRGIFSGNRSICLCNPATKEMVFVPGVDKNKYYWCSMGLAYDPCKSPNRYIIVHLFMFSTMWKKSGLLYKFDVFCSDTGIWTRSSQSVYVPTKRLVIKAECASGVIYWLCDDHLLWYDTEKDLAGVTTLPMIEGKTIIKGHMKIGVYYGKITCCQAWEGGIEVWILSNYDGNWDQLYAASWDRMVEAVELCHGMHLRDTSPGWTFFKRRVVRAAGFDGQFVYITVRMRRDEETDKLFAWETKTGRVEDKGLITVTPIDRYGYDVFFSYANSMARVPVPESS